MSLLNLMPCWAARACYETHSKKSGLPRLLLLFVLGAIASAGATETARFSVRSPFHNVLTKGDASINPDSILLTTNNATKSLSAGSTGRIYYASQIQFLNETGSIPSFSTSFAFQMNRIEAANFGGDGIAFILSPEAADPPLGSIGLYLGLFNRTTDGSSDNHLFAVEFDSFSNSEISSTYEPPRQQHIGVNVNSIESVAAKPLPNGNSFPSDNMSYAWIDYHGENQSLEVRISYASDARPRDAVLNHTIDLSTIVRDRMFVGFSSSTGGNGEAEFHKLFEWNFTASISHKLPAPSGKSKKKTLAAILATVSGFFIIIAAGISWWCWRVKPNQSFPLRRSSRLIQYSYSELSAATGGFNDKRDDKQILGKGGCGNVYKAVFKRGTAAVKVLTVKSIQNDRQFVAELSTLGEYQHQNLVRLHGWCHARGKSMLVYEFLPNGSLADYLFSWNRAVLSWNQRLSIIRGVADAVQYLHRGRDETVLHRDIKAANVLLDADFKPKLGDFGLARLLDPSRKGEMQTVTAAGTRGYIAPEVVYNGKATEKSDVYSFGILCLEIVSGKRTLDPELVVDLVLLEWVWEMQEQQKLMEIVDERLPDFDREEVRCVINMGIACCDMNMECRPTMEACVEILHGRSLPPVPLDARPQAIFRSSKDATLKASSSGSKTPPEEEQIAAAANSVDLLPVEIP